MKKCGVFKLQFETIWNRTGDALKAFPLRGRWRGEAVTDEVGWVAMRGSSMAIANRDTTSSAPFGGTFPSRGRQRTGDARTSDARPYGAQNDRREIFSVLQMAICKTPTIVNCQLSIVNCQLSIAATFGASPKGLASLRRTPPPTPVNSQFSILNSQFSTGSPSAW